MSLLLTLLKYLGLVLSAVSSIWGTLHDATVNTADGRKRLTRAGRVAIGFIAFGLLLNLVASLVEDHLASRRAAAQATTEQRRLRELVLASAPLRALHVEWEFQGIKPEFAAALKDEADWVADMPNTSEDLFQALYGRERALTFAFLNRAKVLFPWLNAQVTGRVEGGPVVMLLALDESASALLVTGVLDAEPKFEEDAGTPDNYEKSKVQAVSAAVEFTESLHAFYTMNPGPERKRQVFSPESLPQLSLHDGSAATMEWNIAAADLDGMIDVAAPRAQPTASLPETIRILVLGGIEDLPASPENFTRPDLPLPIRSEGSVTAKTPATHRSSRLRLTPNNLPGALVEYEMTFLGVEEVANNNPEWEKHYCHAAIWQGRRLTPR